MVLKPQVWERPPQSKSEAQGQSPQARSEAKKKSLKGNSQWGRGRTRQGAHKPAKKKNTLKDSSYFWILWHKSLPNIRKWLQVIFLPKLLFVWPSNIPGEVQKTWSLVLTGHELVMRVYSSMISLRKYQLLPCQTHGAGVSSNETSHLPDIEDSCSSCTF